MIAVLFLWVAMWVQADAGARPSPPAEQGREIFVARCAKCHDADLAKKLPDGTTLLERLARSKDPQSRIATRIKSADEQRAVMAYISPLLAQRSSK
jgi:mono/diheme cytochrome c family protein